MQGFATEVDADGDAFPGEAQAHAQIGRGQVDAGPRARMFAHAVDDRVLGTQGGKLRVAQPARGLTHDVDGERAVRADVALPRQFEQSSIHHVGIAGAEVSERQQHTAGGARLQAGDVGTGQRPGEAHACGMFAHDLHAGLAQLGRQHVRDVERARRKKR